jgi:hypothetical protein
VLARVLAIKELHPDLGPVGLKQLLERDEPGTAWPAASTIGVYLREAGRTVPPAVPAIRVDARVASKRR